jgi:hypothetical protein
MGILRLALPPYHIVKLDTRTLEVKGISFHGSGKPFVKAIN